MKTQDWIIATVCTVATICLAFASNADAQGFGHSFPSAHSMHPHGNQPSTPIFSNHPFPSGQPSQPGMWNGTGVTNQPNHYEGGRWNAVPGDYGCRYPMPSQYPQTMRGPSPHFNQTPQWGNPIQQIGSPNQLHPSGPQNNPMEFGFQRGETQGGAIGGQRGGIAGRLAGQIGANVAGGVSIDPATGRVRGSLGGSVEASGLGEINTPFGGVGRQVGRGVGRGIDFSFGD